MLDVTPTTVIYPTHGGRRPYTIAQGSEVEVVIATSAVRALKQMKLKPGASVRVFVAPIVHVRRARKGI